MFHRCYISRSYSKNLVSWDFFRRSPNGSGFHKWYRKYPNLVCTKMLSFLRVRAIVRSKKLLPKKVCTKLVSIENIFIDRCALVFWNRLIWEKRDKRTRNKSIWIQAIERNIYYHIIIVSILYIWQINSNQIFQSIHHLFEKFNISWFASVICRDSTKAKWIFNDIRTIFQVINIFSNPVLSISCLDVDGSLKLALAVS